MALVTLAVALTLLAVAKHAATGNLADHEVEAGIALLDVALATGAGDAFDGAEEHFVDAASVSVVDTYPAFLIHAGRRMRSLQGGGAEDGTAFDAIAAAVVRRESAEAQARVAALERESPRAAEHWQRLIDALESARE